MTLEIFFKFLIPSKNITLYVGTFCLKYYLYDCLGIVIVTIVRGDIMVCSSRLNGEVSTDNDSQINDIYEI